MEIPVACTLDPSAARAQLGEWQKLLGSAVDRPVRVSPNRLELSLLPGSEVVSVVGLAQREVACCPFFTFTLEIGAERLVLVIEVPNDAIEILDQLVADAR